MIGTTADRDTKTDSGNRPVSGNPRLAPRLLPHEWICGAFLLVLWVRLLPRVGPQASAVLFVFGLLCMNAVLVTCSVFREHSSGWRFRLLFYPVTMNLIYPLLRSWIPPVHPHLEDAALQSADHWVIGGNLSLHLQFLVRPALTDFLSFCYLFYFAYLLSSQSWYFFDDPALSKTFYIGMFTLYGFGYFGYSLLPALGPHLTMAAQFTVPLTGGWLTRANAWLVLKGSNRVDVFPSLHCANTLFILLFDLRHRRWRFWLFLVPCLGICFSTIYLRYHYFVDLICGFALVPLALWLSQLGHRHESRTPHQRESSPTPVGEELPATT
jgi:membrane-associated phospholipid phosphatase